MASKHFFKPPQKKVKCAHCGREFLGGGYRNHCPFCLWSKHVDEKYPGDRQAECQGLMEPIGIEIKKRGQIKIKHRCLKCGKITLNKMADDDNQEEIIRLSSLHDKHGNLKSGS